MASKPNIIIIGGGVIGMATAMELSGRGASVTVLEKNEPGMGCSYGNAGWITPCFALPLAMPGMLFESLRWMMDPIGPLYIKPDPSWTLARWLIRFLRSMNEPLMKRSVAALTELSKFSIEAYSKLNAAHPGQIGFNQKGLLLVSQTFKGMESAIQEMELVAHHGIPGKFLNEAGVRALEPAITGPVHGGVYFNEEAHAEPLSVVRAMRDAALKNGARIVSNTEVFDFEASGGRITGVRTTHEHGGDSGIMHADEYVLATGAWSLQLGRKLGLHLPILGGKGYAITVKPFSPAPSIPIMLVEKKIAITPRDGSIRLAGTLELVNQDDSISAKRVDAILNGSRGLMNLPESPEIIEVWRGLRPCTPDGVPIIGRPRKFKNLLITAGHQMLGLQSAPGTGRLAADLVLGETPTFDPTPFRATRF